MREAEEEETAGVLDSAVDTVVEEARVLALRVEAASVGRVACDPPSACAGATVSCGLCPAPRDASPPALERRSVRACLCLCAFSLFAEWRETAVPAGSACSGPLSADIWRAVSHGASRVRFLPFCAGDTRAGTSNGDGETETIAETPFCPCAPDTAVEIAVDGGAEEAAKTAAPGMENAPLESGEEPDSEAEAGA